MVHIHFCSTIGHIRRPASPRKVQRFARANKASIQKVLDVAKRATEKAKADRKREQEEAVDPLSIVQEEVRSGRTVRASNQQNWKKVL